jgi:hypothetical protein
MASGASRCRGIELPGHGASSPVVIANRVYLTAQTSDTGLHVFAIDHEEGNLLWDVEVGCGNRQARSWPPIISTNPSWRPRP